MKTISLSKGYVCLVDDEDYEYLTQWKWHFWCGYAKRFGRVTEGENKRAVFMHRAILNPPDGVPVDHRNGDRLDNRRSNIRICTPAENARNCKLRKDSKVGIKGVIAIKHSSGTVGYVARIRFNKEEHYLGYFADPESASAAYNAASVRLHGEFSWMNRRRS